MRRFIMVRYYFTCFSYALRVVSPPCVLTPILVGLTEVRYQVDWILSLNVYRASGDVSPLVRTDRIKPDTPSAVRPLFLL